VVFVHGTASGPGRWADMLNSLENDPWLRTRFQYWFFYYDTGNPVTYSADVLRMSLRLSWINSIPAESTQRSGKW